MTERILITGAAGAIGGLLRTELSRPGRELVLLDVTPPPDPAPGEAARTITASVADLGALLDAAEGASAIVHLANLIEDESWEDYARINITGTYNVLEAARRRGVPRVIYASSNHAVGFAERPAEPGAELPATLAPRPDSYYGVCKVASEALCSLYHDRHGLDAICLRIGSCRPEPNDRRCLWSWLSYADAVRLVEAALTAPSPGFRIVWGVSANTRRWWSLEEGRAIGYEPRDDAEDQVEKILAADPDPGGPPAGAGPERVGGPYTAPDFDAPGRTG
ncbi:MAG TPA: NAD(P)-dependent oxidoreductase [Solirubrobacteraceae bacterium]|nr:NAD(P)-dependent oxidoreductase [Solirubrobacteraceae bacterium]